MDKISERLGALTPIERVEGKILSINSDPQKTSEEDRELARGNIKELISSSMEMIPDLVEVVKESESARMYESASNFIKMVAELNSMLVDLSSLPKNSKEASNATPSINNTAVFIGTGDEVFKKLSRRNNEIDVSE